MCAWSSWWLLLPCLHKQQTIQRGGTIPYKTATTTAAIAKGSPLNKGHGSSSSVDTHPDGLGTQSNAFMQSVIIFLYIRTLIMNMKLCSNILSTYQCSAFVFWRRHPHILQSRYQQKNTTSIVPVTQADKYHNPRVVIRLARHSGVKINPSSSMETTVAVIERRNRRKNKKGE